MNPSKKILTDPVFLLLFINSILVLLAYSYNSYFLTISGTITIIKQAFLFLSLGFLLTKNISLRNLTTSSLVIPVAFLVLSALRPSFLNSLYSLSTLFVPYIYILLSLAYLVSQFNFKITFGHLILLFNTVYLFPVLIYFILGAGFEKTNIYGLQKNVFFISNHYGWASAIFLTTAPAILYLFRLNTLYRSVLLGLMVLAFYLLIISANRSSILAVILAATALFLIPKGIFMLKRNNIHLILFMIIVPVYFFQSLKNEDNSAISFLADKNARQFDSGEKKESRIVLTSFAYNHFNNYSYLWLTGVGLFNHDFFQGVTNLGGYHNSYWEILFGGGIVIFFLFVYVMVLRPLYVYFKYIGNFGLVLIPLIIIPFFESNLTGGQFLFFPWFSIMLLMNTMNISEK